MEERDNLLIVVDAGHGGWDNGASFEGRLEKDDNLRLALEVHRQFRRQCINVLMTRDTDVFVELSDRANMANEAGADLFISLHRNSYIEQTPSTNGVENFIYLDAPEETDGHAARLVLDAVVEVGVQSNRGVKRGNYYVLRRTDMPSMLLEMGYIINEEDNRLFDMHLEDYAKAIVIGTLRYFNMPFKGRPPASVSAPAPVVPSPLPPSPVGPFHQFPDTGLSGVGMAQKALNLYFDSGLLVDGVYGEKTRAAAVSALQASPNIMNGANLEADGVWSPDMLKFLPEYDLGDAGEGVALVQSLLAANGYNIPEIDGIYGPQTRTAIQMYQRDNYLVPDGIAGPLTIAKLLE